MARIITFLTSLTNWISYGTWTDCHHNWQPEGFADWHCPLCGADR